MQTMKVQQFVCGSKYIFDIHIYYWNHIVNFFFALFDSIESDQMRQHQKIENSVDKSVFFSLFENLVYHIRQWYAM